MSIRPKTHLGQHFLHDRGTLMAMLAAGEVQPNETVVEIGAGNGVLTKELLLQGAIVEAYEIDEECFPLLRSLAREDDNLTLHEFSVLEGYPPKEKYKVIANIPYYLTGTILRLFLHVFTHQPKRMVLLVQKEVAEKIVAPDTSLLSLAVQMYGKAKIVRRVSKGAFFPPPQVESAIIQIIAHEQPVLQVDREIFFKITRACFHNQRKQIQVSLRQVINLSREQLIDMLQELSIDPTLRPERLSLSQWEAIVNKFQAYLI